MSRHGPSSSGDSFNVFFDKWLARQQAFLGQLIEIEISQKTETTSSRDNLEAIDELIEEILSHYREYEEEKSRVISQDIFLVFSQPWLTSVEKAFLWVAGFKPSLAFSLIQNYIPNMSSEQVDRLERLKADTIRKETEVADAFARVQESVGAPPLMDIIKKWRGLVDGEVSELNKDICELKDAMTKVVKRADELRRSVGMEIVVEILNRDQKVKFLTTVAQVHHWVRAWGIQMDQSSTRIN